MPKVASIRPVKRKTRQRDAIREVFTAARLPLSPQEVAAAAQRSLPSLGIATLYRALKQLLSEGWLDCDKTFNIVGCAGNVQKLATSGFVIACHELTLSGTCRWCAVRR